MKQFFLFFLLFPLAFTLQAQEADSTDTGEGEEVRIIPPINEQMKLGIKLGGGGFMIGGEEANGPSPVFGLIGGAYFRYRFTEHWAFQPEITLSIKGGKFANKVDEYETIRAYFLDFPLLLTYGLNDKNKSNLLFGVQYGFMLNSSLYKKDALASEANSPSMNQHDIMLVAGGQFHTPFVGFQLAAKYGLLDANKGLLSYVGPVNQGKNLRHLAFEFCFIF